MARDRSTDRAIRDGLALLVASLRQEVDTAHVEACLRGLKDVTADVIEEAVDALLRRLSIVPHGRRFFPTVVDWFAECQGVIAERRKTAARQVKALQEDCPDCGGTGLRTVDDKANIVTPCTCQKRAVELMANVTAPLKMPALPPSSESEAT